jgi:hypothetical protein
MNNEGVSEKIDLQPHEGCLRQKTPLGGKEYIERRHGEPFKFLFLPKMGLLGSQAVLEKKVQF